MVAHRHRTNDWCRPDASACRTADALWHVTVTRRDGSVHRYIERRGRYPEIGEVIEVRDAIGPPLIARIQAIHHDSQAPGAIGKWNVAAIEIGGQ